MDGILSIEQLRAMATTTIEIPGFDGSDTIKVRVQKPKLLEMASQGKIPNYLMNVAVTKLTGHKASQKKEPTPEEKMKIATDAIDLYCMVCLVEPTYEEFKPIMTDDQKFAVFSWAMGEVSTLNSFRNNKENGSSDNNGKEVLQEAK